MNLLPKTHQDFAKEKYWDEFFAKLQSSPFEWYGEYGSLSGILDKYIRAKDKLLVIGCGNSTLSSDLYSFGFHHIVNIDISATVIKQMRTKHEKKCPNMVFEKMDMYDMSFENEEYNVVLDKGTLDAVLINSSEETMMKTDKAFSEISRVLKYGGRYICVSLLQEHILKKILEWFMSEGWIIRIQRCFEAEDRADVQSLIFPVFVVVCTKLKKHPGASPVLEIALDQQGTLQRISDASAVTDSISSIQYFAFLKHRLSKSKVVEENIFLELYCAVSGRVKYQLYVVDSTSRSSLQYAIFIVPQGRETEWLFSTQDGRQELALSAKCERLIVVHLLRDFTYASLDEVKSDLSAYVMELAPSSLKSQVPFLSLGDDVGWREIKANGKSEVSGLYIVEDVLGKDNEFYRRLIFLTNPYLIQSEAKLKNAQARRKKGKKNILKIDFSYLACGHHSAMISGLAFLTPNMTSPKILIIGLGGGGLSMYLHQHLPNAKIDVVELDPDVVQIAQNWFGVQVDRRLSVIVADGIVFMKDAVKNVSQYDVIMLDADSKDPSLGISCPPPAFVDPDMLLVMSKLVGAAGVVMINLVCRNVSLRNELCAIIKSSFASVFHRKIPSEVNDVLYCLNAPTQQNVLADVKHQAVVLQDYMKEQSNSVDCFDVSDVVECLKELT